MNSGENHPLALEKTHFIWTRGKHAVGIEVKASARWRPEHGRPLAELREAGVIAAAYGVYLGEVPLRAGLVSILPLHAFLRRLAAGKVLTTASRTPRRA